MSNAVCYDCEVFGDFEVIKDFCDCSFPNPKYPSVSSFKIPEDFDRVEG